MWLYKIVLALNLATETVQAASYTISNDTNNWENRPCKLAVPKLKYSIDKGWTLNEPQLQVPQEGLWIGFMNAMIAFDYLGCSSAGEHDTNVVRNISDCHLMCQGGAFGIQKTGSKDTIRCWCLHTHADLLEKSCNVVCGHNELFVCGENNSNFFAIYDSIDVQLAQTSDESAQCLDFNYPNFKWGTCGYKHFNQLLCSNLKDGQRFAEIQNNTFRNTWWDANVHCLSVKKFPATAESVRQSNKTWGYQQNQNHWTGVIRTFAVIYADNKGLITSSSIKYAFIKSDGSMAFETGGNKRSLCEESDDPGAEHKQERESPKSTAVGIGIGVSVAFICLAGATITIIVLKKRGILSCKLGADKKQPANGNIAFEENMTYTKGLDDTARNHNYFILEKGSHSVNDNIDDNNTPCESNHENGEDGNYNAIEDIGEPNKHFKDSNGDYGYTTNNLASGSKPDNVYNKLKLNRPGDYDHVDKRKHNVIQAGNDYDTTSTTFAPSDADVSDYNHIPHHVEGNGDYDINTGRKVKLAPSDASGYAHVKI